MKTAATTYSFAPFTNMLTLFQLTGAIKAGISVHTSQWSSVTTKVAYLSEVFLTIGQNWPCMRDQKRFHLGWQVVIAKFWNGSPQTKAVTRCVTFTSTIMCPWHWFMLFSHGFPQLLLHIKAFVWNSCISPWNQNPGWCHRRFSFPGTRLENKTTSTITILALALT